MPLGPIQRLNKRLVNVRQARAQNQSFANQTPQAPYDPNLEYTKIAEQAKLNNSVRDLDYQGTNIKTSYGLDPSVSDPSSATYNPYSRAALLQSSYNNSRRSTLNNLASSGQLYSGFGQSMFDKADSSYAQGFTGLQTSYNNALGDIESKKLAAKNAADLAIAKAEAQSLVNAEKQTPNPAEAPQNDRFYARQIKGLKRRRNQLIADRRAERNR